MVNNINVVVVSFDNLCKTFLSLVQESEPNWLLSFFMFSSYVVISVLNAFQVAIVLRNIQYLRLLVYVFGQ